MLVLLNAKNNCNPIRSNPGRKNSLSTFNICIYWIRWDVSVCRWVRVYGTPGSGLLTFFYTMEKGVIALYVVCGTPRSGFLGASVCVCVCLELQDQDCWERVGGWVWVCLRAFGVSYQ